MDKIHQIHLLGRLKDAAVAVYSKQQAMAIKTNLFYIVRHDKDVCLFSHVRLDLRVGIIDDGQEHVDENEEHEEDKKHEEDWTQDAVGLLQLVEVEITQDDAEQRETDRVLMSHVKKNIKMIRVK